MQHAFRTCRWQRLKPELRVGGVITPAVLILRAVVDEQQETGGGQALHQTIEQGLGLGVDPVQILEDEQQGLELTLPQEQAFEGVQGTLAALRWIEGLPWRIFHRA